MNQYLMRLFIVASLLVLSAGCNEVKENNVDGHDDTATTNEDTTLSMDSATESMNDSSTQTNRDTGESTDLDSESDTLTSGCVVGTTLYAEVCQAACESATTEEECQLVSWSLPYPDWDDFWHLCSWHPMTATQLDESGNCTFGETIGRCVYYAGGEGGDEGAGVWCEDVLFRSNTVLQTTVDDATYLSLVTDANPYNPSGEATVKACDTQENPICSCACQSDFPISTGWNECDTPTAENACRACASCANMSHCYDRYWTCREINNCAQLDNCVSFNCIGAGTAEWLACYDACVASTGATSDALKEFYSCLWCDTCTDSCATDASPTCIAWTESE